FQTHFHLAQPEDLTGLQSGLGDLFTIDESAVGGIEVLDDDVVAPLNQFAVMTGNGSLGDLEGVVFKTSDGGFVHLQFVGQSGQPFAEHNKFRHRLVGSEHYPDRSRQVKLFVGRRTSEGITDVQSTSETRRTTASSRVARAKLPGGIARKTRAWSCGACPRRSGHSN